MEARTVDEWLGKVRNIVKDYEREEFHFLNYQPYNHSIARNLSPGLALVTQ